jgi:hypothetical protein
MKCDEDGCAKNANYKVKDKSNYNRRKDLFLCYIHVRKEMMRFTNTNDKRDAITIEYIGEWK